MFMPMVNIGPMDVVMFAHILILSLLMVMGMVLTVLMRMRMGEFPMPEPVAIPFPIKKKIPDNIITAARQEQQELSVRQ